MKTLKKTTLELENWMLEENYWKTSTSENIQLEADATLQLECWMLDQSNWGVKEGGSDEEETKLELESWMFNLNFLGKRE